MELIVNLHGGTLKSPDSHRKKQSLIQKKHRLGSSQKLLSRSKLVDELKAFNIDEVPGDQWDETMTRLTLKGLGHLPFQPHPVQLRVFVNASLSVSLWC